MSLRALAYVRLPEVSILKEPAFSPGLSVECNWRAIFVAEMDLRGSEGPAGLFAGVR